MKRYDKTRKALMFWCLFIGVGALAGGICMLIKPTGEILHMENLLPYFKVLPFSDYLFQDYFFSGIALIVVNGITNLIAALLLKNNRRSGFILGGIFGITLMLWIMIQFYIFPLNFLDIIYFIFGVIQAITGYMCYVFYSQETFRFNINDYRKINTNDNELVVYFSRMGYTRKIAYEIADTKGAHIIELTTKEHTVGTSGFWWCGRFGMHRWPMEINEIEEDITKYENITIVSPVWVFNVSAPVKDFCLKYNSKLKNVNYVIVHFMKNELSYIADDMDKMLNNTRKSFISICSRLGKRIY